MSDAEEFFNGLADKIPGVKPGKMFGASCLKMPNGKSAAMFWKDHIVVKLSGAERTKALSLEGARLFEPMEGRPMKEWVQIPFSFKNKWKDLAEKSAKAVGATEKKPAKKKK